MAFAVQHTLSRREAAEGAKQRPKRVTARRTTDKRNGGVRAFQARGGHDEPRSDDDEATTP